MTGHLRQPPRRVVWVTVLVSLMVGLVLLGSGFSTATVIGAGRATAPSCASSITTGKVVPALAPCTSPPALTFTSPLPGGEVGVSYTSTLTFTGGALPLTWSVSAGSLPAGLTLSGGVISGTPTAAVNASFTVTLTDGQNRVASKAVTLTVIAGPTFTFAAPPSGVIGTAYSQSLTASGGTPSLVWSVPTGSTLPAGLTLNSSSGLLSGTPTSVGTFPFSVKVTDSLAQSNTRSITLTISKLTSTVVVTTSGPSVTFGTTTTLTATVGPAGLTGSVTFEVMPSSGAQATTSVALGSVPVVNGVATMPVVLDAFGANKITGTYSGDATHAAATSSLVMVEVAGYAGEVIVTEFRASGPNGSNDSYTELYNASDTSVPLGGFIVANSSGASVTVPDSAAPVPTHQSYLLTGTDFSLAATSDLIGAALGSGGIRVSAPDTAATQTDAVGPSADFHRGTGLPAVAGSPTDQYAWVRLSVAGRPKDTGNNVADFKLVSDTGAMIGGVQSTRGSASPTGGADPLQYNATLQSILLDPAVGIGLPPNRDYTRATGTLIVRRTITNSSGMTIGAAKVRVTALSEANGAPQPGVAVQPATHANLRVVNPVAATSTLAVTNRGNVIVQNLSVDDPITGAAGGGLNSTLTVPLPQGGLLSGDSIDVAFTFRVDTGGAFWFGYDVDALPLSDCPQGLRGARAMLSC